VPIEDQVQQDVLRAISKSVEHSLRLFLLIKTPFDVKKKVRGKVRNWFQIVIAPLPILT
jgi:hypothetical protein